MSGMLPSIVSKLLLKDNTANDNREVIRDNELHGDVAVPLTEEQKTLRERYRKAHELMTDRRYNMKEMHNILCKTFKYAVATARRDIYDAQYIYGQVDKLNKPYLIGIHLQRIDDFIRYLKDNGKPELIEKMIGRYTDALKLLQDDTEGNTTPAAIIMTFSAESAAVIQNNPNATIDAIYEEIKDQAVIADLSIDDIDLNNL